ncbi:hypothetical protein Bca4012_026878 [Brassica carinata]
MEQATNRAIGFLNMPSPCRSHGTLTWRFFWTAPPLLKKTGFGFIRMRLLKLTVIKKEISTVSYQIPTQSMIFVDVVGHMRLVNGKSLIEPPVLDELEIGKARHVLVHVQSHDGPVMKLYLWDDAAREFCKKFKSYEITPTVLLVTTVNTKTIGGSNFCLQFSFLTFTYPQRCPAYHRVLRLVNGNKGDDHEVPVPEALISTIGQRHKFCVKVTEHNLSGKTRALTVTKILTLATPPVTESLEGNHNTAATEETFETGNDVREASQSRVDTSEGSKRSFDSAEIEGTKRPKCGK